MTEQKTRAQQLVGDVAPKLAQLTDEVLFGDAWARAELSRRDRSLITVAALTALGRTDQLRSHLSLALENGVTSRRCWHFLAPRTARSRVDRVPSSPCLRDRPTHCSNA